MQAFTAVPTAAGGGATWDNSLTRSRNSGKRLRTMSAAKRPRLTAPVAATPAPPSGPVDLLIVVCNPTQYPLPKAGWWSGFLHAKADMQVWIQWWWHRAQAPA